MLCDLFGTTFSEGTLFLCQQSASRKLEGFLSSVREALVGSDVVHFDETGLRLCGKLNWLHSASTPDLTLYTVDKRRGKAGMDHAGVLPSFTGVAVHDGWASYLHYACRHALCNAHHLRELTALYEQEGQEWASKMRHLLVEIKRAVEASKADGEKRLLPLLRQKFLERYQSLLQEGFAANPPNLTETAKKRGRKKQSRGYNLLKRLEQGREETLRFMDDFSVPFDNNLAERDIRMMKVQQKVSGGFRSAEGADAFCRIRSYISTLRKQGQSVLPALQLLLTGQPCLPTTCPE
jgi:transposase